MGRWVGGLPHPVYGSLSAHTLLLPIGCISFTFLHCGFSKLFVARCCLPLDKKGSRTHVHTSSIHTTYIPLFPYIPHLHLFIFSLPVSLSTHIAETKSWKLFPIYSFTLFFYMTSFWASQLVWIYQFAFLKSICDHSDFFSKNICILDDSSFEIRNQ